MFLPQQERPERFVTVAIEGDLCACGAFCTGLEELKLAVSGFADLDDDSLNAARRGFAYCLYALGLKLEAPAQDQSEIPEEVARLAAERWQAKQDKEWTRSDELRDEIAKAGWKVVDSKDGYTLSPV